MKMNISKVNQTPKPQTASGARMTVPKNPFFSFKSKRKRNNNNNNNNNNNKLTPKKPKTNNGVNNMNVNNGVVNRQRVINNARLELNKLISLRQNQKSNYLEKMKKTPSNIPSILNNAKRLASTQRVTRSRTSDRNQTPK
jgi:hypothetical protein